MTSKQNWEIAKEIPPKMRPPSRNCKVCGELRHDRFKTVSGRYCIQHMDKNPQPWKVPQPVDELTPILLERNTNELLGRRWGKATKFDCRGVPSNLNKPQCENCLTCKGEIR